MDSDRAWDVSGDPGVLEGATPPFQVLHSAARWGAWYERTVMEDGQHGLQRGEKSAAFSDDQA